MFCKTQQIKDLRCTPNKRQIGWNCGWKGMCTGRACGVCNKQFSHNGRQRLKNKQKTKRIAQATHNFIKKTKTRHKAAAASARVCFHRLPGNKSSRHMKADSIVSCDGAKGVLIFRFPQDTRRGLAPLVSPCCANRHQKKKKKRKKEKK